MRLRNAVKLGLALARHPIYTGLALWGGDNPASTSLNECMRRGAAWLLLAQARAPDGEGYSRSFSLVSGWDRCYIETTGYIIPTLLEIGNLLAETRFRDSAIRAAEWLLTVQEPDGAFTDIDAFRPQAFDTGQVMLGLNRMFRDTGDQRFLESAVRAGRWLVGVQEDDGSWRRFAYNDRPHAYYSRVGAALIETGLLGNVQEFIDKGRRNLEWVLRQEQRNGYYKYSEFAADEHAFLHTIVYVLEGFSMAYELTRDSRWADALVRGASALKGLHSEDGLPFSQYNEHWNATNREYCMTGLAQYAGLCVDVFTLSGNEEFLRLGREITTVLCRRQLHRGIDIRGALPSSVPLWGAYGGMELYNWNVKFFLDAVLKVSEAMGLRSSETCLE